MSEPSIDLDQLSLDIGRVLLDVKSTLRDFHREIEFPDKTTGAVWDLFLGKEEKGLIETCAIACAVISLSALPDPRDSALMEKAENTIRHIQQHTTGGFTSWITMSTLEKPGEREETLTLDTFYALSALHSRRIRRGDDTFDKALMWLVSCQNAADGGWGFYKGGPSFTLPTAYAVRLLAWAAREGSTLDLRDATNHGVQWLLETRSLINSDGFPQRRAREAEPSSVHTALSCMALIESGLSPSGDVLAPSLRWLIEHADSVDGILDAYTVPDRASSIAESVGRRISHTSFNQGIVIQGLLAGQVSIFNSKLISLVTGLTRSCAKGTWKCEGQPQANPIYAIMDATLGLAPYEQALRQNTMLLEIADRIERADLERKIESEALNRQLAELTAQTESLKREAASRDALILGLQSSTLHNRAHRLWLFVKQHKLASFVAVLAVFALGGLAYGYATSLEIRERPYVVLGSLLAAFIGLLWAVIEIVRSDREIRRNKPIG